MGPFRLVDRLLLAVGSLWVKKMYMRRGFHPAKSILLWKTVVASVELVVICLAASFAYSHGIQQLLVVALLLCLSVVIEGSSAYGKFRAFSAEYDQVAYRLELERYDGEQDWLSKGLRFSGIVVVAMLLLGSIMTWISPIWEFGVFGAVYYAIYVSKFYVRAAYPPMPSKMKATVSWTG